MVEVADSADESACAALLEAAGLRLDLREPEWHQHRLFKLDGPRANIHVFSAGCPETERMVAFRDVLVHDAEARDAYAATKKAPALEDRPRVQAYADAKTEVVTRLLERDPTERARAR